MTARYDRLAPLGVPDRTGAFPCWSVLRDLEGQERDSDIARRARLRFLALRPVQRLAIHGLDPSRVESLARQIDHVREELGQLPARDLERAALARFLNELRTLQPDRVVAAALKVCEFAEQSGQLAAAEEYARSAADFAQQLHNDSLNSVATRSLARILLGAGLQEEAETLAGQACDFALVAENRVEWLRGLAQLAAVYRAAGQPARASDVLTQGLRRARDWRDDALVGLALAQLCRHSAMVHQADEAIEQGWGALRLLDQVQERCEILRVLGYVMLPLGLTRAAERCFILAQRSEDPWTRAASLAGVSVCAALSKDYERYIDRRNAAAREATQVPRMYRASVHSDLARAALIAGEFDHAREHVRETLDLLSTDGHREVRRRAEEVLGALEHQGVLAVAVPPTASLAEQTRRIAAELERSAEAVISAG
jgi:tetratricopeptide (TPR) repeat protein